MNIKFTFKKTILLAFSYILLAGLQMINAQTNNVGINTTTPDASAALDVVSTTQGMLVPRMTAAQRGFISSPATGLMVYQSDAPAGFYFYNGTAWTQLGAMGPQGFQGTQGTTGSIGPQGNQGLTGPAGQGVPIGGITGQVLSKVDATDYNTQWVTTTGGSNAFPSIEVGVLNNTTQTISNIASSGTLVDIVFSGTNTGTPTGSNTWNGTTFTVGSSGWYQFNVQLKGVTSTNTETNIGIAYILSIDSSTNANSLMSTFDLNTNATASGLRNSSKINGVVYLTAGQTVRFKGQSWGNTTGISTYTSIDKSTSITIIRMK